MAMLVDIDTKTELGFPYWKPIRRRFGPESPFFSSGNIERELLAKQVALDLSEDEKHRLQDLIDEDGREVVCPIVGCGAHLISLEHFEDHYNGRHTASCSVCSRVYPTSLLLNIHVSEAHDSFFQAKVARGYAMYECLVEGCGLKFKNYKGRQQHLVDKHKFPSSFEFFKKAHLSKKARQKQHRKQAIHRSEETSSKMDIEGETIDGLVSAVSKLSTSDSSPSSISFGRRNTRGVTFVPRAVQREKRADSVPTGGKQ
ncbi:uncharacterized protein [Populus alba]|uniref:C2H2-type domain-containing protein n=2 Tax=Populus alba TaxID=43335 RepID=A0A4U5NA90_POPAL|nr:zinc finger protein 511 isoform X2 [Populus alba]TKR79534.1 hypothetical protein D5086_0000271120 [Populus alba]